MAIMRPHRARLNKEHFAIESHRQRMTEDDWAEILLKSNDHLIFNGKERKLIAKDLGYGILEIYKQPLYETTLDIEMAD